MSGSNRKSQQPSITNRLRPKLVHFFYLLVLSAFSTGVYILITQSLDENATLISFLSHLFGISRTHPENVTSLTSPWNCSHCFPWNYEPALDQKNACVVLGRNQTIEVVFLIPSAHARRAQRDAIRRTWASVTSNNTSSFRRVFFFGRTEDARRMREVEEESRHFRDVVIMGFEDTYRNLTLKTLMMLRWLTERCSNARFFLKVDDDMWVNRKALMAKVIPLESRLSTAIGGYCKMHSGVIRNRRNKWSPSLAEYPASQYPKYCSGTAYVGTVQMARRIVSVSRNIPFFFLEDVFIGLCLRQLGLHVLNIEGFNMGVPQAVRQNICRAWGADVVTLHQISADRLVRLWNCSQPRFG